MGGIWRILNVRAIERTDLDKREGDLGVPLLRRLQKQSKQQKVRPAHQNVCMARDHADEHIVSSAYLEDEVVERLADLCEHRMRMSVLF